jgi:hypothetical protein
MARNTTAQSPPGNPVASYKYPSKRKNIPPAGLAAQGTLQDAPKLRYEYNPHLPPTLRSAPDAAEADRLPEYLEVSRKRALTDSEARTLATALRKHEPWLEWSSKREKPWFEVEPVALHIHERVSTQAILRMLARQDVQRDLFADPQQSYAEAVQFYKYDVDWANRLILGDSLQVMASLARREDLTGKVQMIYFDPPYGIRFSSNFQPQLGQRDVKDREQDLTREPEMVKAYRDTWTLGIHSYLAYLRDRLAMAKELLADTGSVFVQISDENLHRIRCVMDVRASKNSDAKRFLNLHIGSPVSISSRNQRQFSPVAVFSPKGRDNCRRALASTSGAEMSHGQHSPTTSPACRRCMAELSRCHVKLTESRSRTVWSYKIAGTAARWLNQTYSSTPVR